MKVKINDTDIVVDNYDTYQLVLKKYAILSKTSPSYLRFDKIPRTFEDGKIYNVSNILNELSKIKTVQNFDKKEYRLKSLYVNLDRKSIFNLWVISQSPNKQDIDFKENYIPIFKKVFPSRFTSQDYKRNIIEFMKNEGDKIKKLIQEVETEQEILKNFKNVKPFPYKEFKLETYTEESFLELKDNYSIYDIFDKIDVSEAIPFIKLLEGDKTLFKVFKDIIPIRSWIEKRVDEDDEDDDDDITTEDGIYIYVLDNNYKINKLKEYSNECIWTKNNVLKIINKTGSKSDTIRDKIFNSIGNRISYQNEKNPETIQTSVSGFFSIPDVNFNKAVFSDMIMNNTIFRYFLYLKEVESSVIKKNRFVFYYEPNQKGLFDSSLTIKTTSQSTEESIYLDIRISRANSLNEVYSFINIFKGIFGIYMKDKDKIKAEYKKLYSKSDFEVFEKTLKRQKENKKTKGNLQKLIDYDEEVFGKGSNYSGSCQPSAKQPYIIEDGDRLEFSKVEPGFENHGIIKWKKSEDADEKYYACYRPGKDDNPYKYPGLVKVDHDWKYAPCCFKVNQYNKKQSKLKEYLSTETLTDNIDVPYSLHVVGSKKITKIKQFSKLPLGFGILLKSVYPNYNKTILRTGVISSNKSFVHALEMATNENFRNMNTKQEMNKRVSEVLKEMSEIEHYAFSKQELYDMSDSDIRKALVEKDRYIDPDLFISIFEHYYDCNIIVLKIDEIDDIGNFSTPRHSKIYLPKDLDREKKTVVVLKANFDIKHTEIYQCDVVVKHTETMSSESFMFDSNDEFIKALFLMKNKLHNVYTIFPNEEYKKYIPVKI